MQTVKVGVIGTGSLGRRHVQGYQTCPDVEIVGVYDINPATLALVCDEFGVPGAADAAEVIAQADAVSVVVPADRHYPVARPVLDAGKHLLVEKPLTNNSSEAAVLVDLAADRGVVMAVGHLEQFNPVLGCLEEVPGPPRYIRAERLAPYPPLRLPLKPRGCEVSVVLDLMIHDIEVVLRLVGSEPVDIQARGQTLISDSEDIAWCRLTFADGCVAELTASRVNPAPSRRLFVAKDTAHFELGYATQEGVLTRWNGQGTETTPLLPGKTNPLFDELADFAACVRAAGNGESRVPRVTGQTGLRALRVAEKVIEHIRDSRRQMP